MLLFWIIPLLGVSLATPPNFRLSKSLKSHPEYSENTKAIQELLPKINELMNQLGLDDANLRFDYPNQTVEDQLLELLKDLWWNIEVLKIKLGIPRIGDKQNTRRHELERTGLQGNKLEIFTLYKVSLEDLAKVQEILQIPDRSDKDTPDKRVSSNQGQDTNVQRRPTENDFDSENDLRSIEATPCPVKQNGYESLISKVIQFKSSLTKVIISLRNAIRECNFPDSIIETYRGFIPHSIQTLIFDDTTTICIKNTKYGEELIADDIDWLHYKLVFTWIPRNRRNVSKWKVDYENDSMKFSSQVYRSYLSLDNSLFQVWGGSAFTAVQTDDNWDVEVSSESGEKVSLKHVKTGKYIFVNGSKHDPERRHVMSTLLKPVDGGSWEFTDCEDELLSVEPL